ncbi:hypothetical protein TIFTF001_035367 [Ficus carica]|uniref:Uncharacterized protein n=1 Tax=Ficus carica TaxID=3494 RepID=A0AA88E252_FICCA|nr:hypothetical protein TIFTF001_035367 [Ficus carica]
MVRHESPPAGAAWMRSAGISSARIDLLISPRRDHTEVWGDLVKF